MSDLPGRLVARFGQEGLRRIDTSGAASPPGVSALLAEVGVPRQVGPYFVSDEGPVALGEFRRSVGATVPEDERARWPRIGSDRGADLCVDGDGGVRAEYAGAEGPGPLVNRSLDAFLESLLALDEGLSSLASTESVPEQAELVRALLRRLSVADPGPAEAADSWWLAVLQDVRHTMMQAAYAAFEVLDAEGLPQILTSSGGLCLHPEERLWEELRASGVKPGQVRKVYTELEACFLPGHYCSLWLAEVFPDAEFTHSFPYDGTAQEREEGFVALLREAAARRASEG
ncbi:nucleic acid/nucleotide deaminase domain-containing protein [Streptomyces avicenniae]|uniref:nucleic acid/nucleotide deaminase domain-containing protein n=1 Tax=Streptomyces avicenniae TaxID=500153 RepID=UPI00167C5D96|nr:nucleic acid/nucleotide deaminase domain-containing protein [Streptomyces avicenniae]